MPVITYLHKIDKPVHVSGYQISAAKRRLRWPAYVKGGVVERSWVLVNAYWNSLNSELNSRFIRRLLEADLNYLILPAGFSSVGQD